MRHEPRIVGELVNGLRINRTKGELALQADSDAAVALGVPGTQAYFRQKREGLDEFIEGNADRIDYDSRSDLVKLTGNAKVRRLRGSTTADEITGNLITYDNRAELFNVAGDNAAGSR